MRKKLFVIGAAGLLLILVLCMNKPAFGEIQPTVEPLATRTPAPTATPEPTPLRSATIRNVGDFVIHDALIASAKQEDDTYDFAPMLELISDCIANADYTIANVDGPLCGNEKRPYLGYPQFNTPPELISDLKDAGVDMLTLANNHALDSYYDGLQKEIENCVENGMAYVGAARSQEEHDTPVIVEINGIRLGVLNYTQTANGMEALCVPEASTYGLNFAHKADFKADVAALKEAGADVVAAYIHFGTEYIRQPDQVQKNYARLLAKAGCDVIVGSHPHVVQPAVWLDVEDEDGSARSVLCLYSLGNFLSDQRKQYRDGGIIFEYTIEETETGEFEITSPKYIPTYVWRTGEAGERVYHVVPCGKYLFTSPEGMDEEAENRMVDVWNETVEHMGDVCEPLYE